MFFKKTLNFHIQHKYKNLIKLIIIYLLSICFLLFVGTSYCNPIIFTIIVFYLYFDKHTDKKEKWIYLLTWFVFSFNTIIGESITTYLHPNKSLKYHNSDIYNVASWLFSAYAIMTLFIFYLRDYFSYIIGYKAI